MLLLPQVSDTLSVAGMESFIQKQEKLLETMPSKAPENEGDREAKEPTVHNASTCKPQPLECQDDDDNPGKLFSHSLLGAGLPLTKPSHSSACLTCS